MIQPVIQWKALREASGVSQRELAQRSGISQATLSRIESGDRDANAAEEALLATILEAPTPKPAESQGSERITRGPDDAEHHARPGVRRAYICVHEKCLPPRRVFLPLGASDQTPECPEHGRMVRQENRPYFGQAT